MSLQVTQLSIVDLDENDPYYDLYNDIFLDYQTHINVNANHPAFPHLLLTEHPNKEGYITVCTSYISIAKHYDTLTLDPIPDTLTIVLSAFGLSRNVCILQINTESLGAILDPLSNNN
ncbi:7056_t:CDS:2 [Scutellospora calospora]|uniref:7056_t:CDS:1 n=1 Tax=Scutellospora calospora TaxID=85575 RepID=A0ACA9KDV3_9GLOM|nr:7056_t:CDS:2 [Scutellospora calospora]